VAGSVASAAAVHAEVVAPGPAQRLQEVARVVPVRLPLAAAVVDSAGVPVLVQRPLSRPSL
jgi:hypothetical protein